MTIDPNTVAHTPLEDAQGLLIGCFLTSVGLVFLTQLGFLTGQTAGIALLIAYPMGWSFGLVFFLINLPFYFFAYMRLGLEFTLKSLFCVTSVSVLSDRLPLFIVFESLNPIIGTLVFGVTVGLGLLACFRHKGSLGGMGVLALVIQDSTGFKAGYTQLLVDVAIFAVAIFIFPASVVAYSFLGAVVLNGVIAFNHRRDRYVAP
ncbi:YitT family protein [Pseudorhodobacter sp. W20_MBD10_FR17]|uniref:YitT family protein n=1 Tax=Pseudorhodobacter sp. W20_MBD10_FR17 TaxID=3240266 RepID=UPI003F9C82FC